ncbi:MAG TPA: Ig-like domain-containing protein, partial [Cyclobacteriaceae bacterium]|nr:Ig-like domain-containing protein [Cyclobacteriaceae bacterium]
ISSIIFLNDAEDPLGAPTRRISFIARDQQESGPVYHIFVSYPGNTAPVADDVEDPNCIELDEDTPHIINLSASDADGDNLNFIIVTPPSHGTLTGSGPEFTYTPDQDYFGPDSFTFKVNDGTDDSNIAEVCLNVLPVNDPPVAVDDTATTTTNVAITFNITDNDFDVDGNIEPSTVDLDPSSPGQQKTFTVEAEGIYEVDNAGNLTFTPAFNYQGVASAIFYTVEDNDGAVSNQASIIVTVNLGQLRPVAVDDVADTQLNTPITFNITDNDFDPDGQIEPSTVDLDPSIAGEQKTYAVTGEGNFSVDNSGNVSFTPAADFTGTVVIIYTLKDNDGLLSNEATISVNVVDPASANTAPLAEDLELEVQQNTPKDFSLAASDADDDPLTFIIVTNPANGTLSGTGPAFTYTPNTDYLGADEFTYKVNDGTEDSNVATVSITVIQDTSAPENRAPRIAP